MKFVNLANVEKELLNFALAKYDFENLWISKGVIQDRLTIAEFISCIDIEYNILCINKTNSYVPFKYMFHVGELDEYAKSYLEVNKYLDNIKKIDQNKLVANDIDRPLGDFYLIINNEMYQ